MTEIFASLEEWMFVVVFFAFTNDSYNFQAFDNTVFQFTRMVGTFWSKIHSIDQRYVDRGFMPFEQIFVKLKIEDCSLSQDFLFL